MSSAISRNDIDVFVEGFSNFFNLNLGENKFELDGIQEVDPANLPVREITGIVGVSGSKKGCVYFTANKKIIAEVLRNIGEDEDDDDILKDMAGEITNTIAGNAGIHFGKEFQISVPVVVSGRPDSIYLPKNSSAVVISARYKDQKFSLVVCIK
jgi:chemotaxis protein CheX